MATYIFRRLLVGVLVLIIVSIVVFIAMRILPGDPIYMLITETESKEFTEQQIAQLKQQFGLDKPLAVQYFNWLKGIFEGDLGNSIIHRAPVAGEIIRRLPITLHLGIAAYLVGVCIGIPAGILCAIRRGKVIDTIVTTFSNLGITIPAFWLGLMMIYFFGLYLRWLPVQGYTSPFTDFVLNFRQLIMPVICLALFPIASNTRQTRSSMLEVMRQDYIRTAWSKGLRERVVIIRHALKNGLIPVLTLSAMGFSMIIGGSVVIETVFNIPGMGRLAVTAIINHDYPYVQGIVLIISTFVMFTNILVDLAYGWIDPRIRFS
ncbi:MAG TPA: ABC transporter permease [Dehalococcoidales bacterium]|nr:ABC transporter permease [Dehalococcoidales bacterium]